MTFKQSAVSSEVKDPSNQQNMSFEVVVSNKDKNSAKNMKAVKLENALSSLPCINIVNEANVNPSTLHQYSFRQTSR